MIYISHRYRYGSITSTPWIGYNLASLAGSVSRDSTGALVANVYRDDKAPSLGKDDYGYVAIATSELAASLRKAGAPKAAYPFETMALQSTMSGILQQKGVDPDDIQILDVAPGSDRLTLNPKAKDLLIEYQKTVLALEEARAAGVVRCSP